MGMFDSFLIKLKCPTCKKIKLQEIQTKEFANILANYRIGDVVEEAPIGEFWLKENWWCEYCRQKKLDKNQYEHFIYLHLIDGLFIDFFSKSEYLKQRKKALDTYQIMQLYRQSAYKGTNCRFLIQRIYNYIRDTKKQWEKSKGKEEKFLIPIPKNSDELLDEIIQMIERFKVREPEITDEAPW